MPLLIILILLATPVYADGWTSPPGVCAPSSLSNYVATAKAQWTQAGYPRGYGDGCHITFTVGDAAAHCGRPAAGCAESSPNRCLVTIDPKFGPTYTQTVTTHELGHCLGLPHSRSKRALMYGSGPITAQNPTGIDAKAIRKLYSSTRETPAPKSETKGRTPRTTTTTTVAKQACAGPTDYWRNCLVDA